MGEQVRKNRWKMVIGGCLLFAFFMILQLRRVDEQYFAPDELDIFDTAFEMFRGRKLYTDITSQHMPFAYYFSLLFYALGARTTAMQRVYFYVFFSGAWTFIFFRYRRYVGKWSLILHPVMLYIFFMNYEYGTQILSEHIGIIGVDLMLCELIRFLKTRELPVSSDILLSFAVLCTFGTMFITIFGIFFLALAVFAAEIRWYRKDSGRVSLGKWLGTMGKRYGRLLLILAAPWIIMAVYMLITGSLGDFIYGAYTINRKIYPNYNTNGIGGSILTTFLSALIQPGEYLLSCTSEWIYGVYLLQIAVMIAAIYFCYLVVRKYGFFTGFFTFFFIFSYGSRGYFNFHGTTAVGVMVLAALAGLEAKGFRSWKEFDQAGTAKKVLYSAFVVYSVLAYFGAPAQEKFTDPFASDTEILKTVLDDDDRVWMLNTNTAPVWNAKRVTTGPSVSTPWMWEARGKAEFTEEFRENAPKAVLFTEDFETWGYYQSDYAPEAVKFVEDNYRKLPDSDEIYVQNDYYEEACRKLNVSPESQDEAATATDADGEEATGSDAVPFSYDSEGEAQDENGNLMGVTTEAGTSESATTEEVTSEAVSPAQSGVTPADRENSFVQPTTDADGYVTAPDGTKVKPQFSDGAGPGSDTEKAQ